MKSTRSVSALLAILVCASAAADEISWAKDFASAKAKAKATGRLVMVDFYTDWCIWCKEYDKTTFIDEKVIKLVGQMATVKVDAEKEGVALAKKYNVGSYPTVLFLDSEGEVWGRLETYLQPDGFAYYVEEVMFAHGIYPSAKKALKSSPSDGKANCQIARVHAMRGNLKLASAALRIMEAAKYKSDDAAKAYNVVGDRYQTEDKFDEAIMCFEKADQATGDPKERSYALTSLIYCYLGKQDLDSAKKYARLVIGLKGADKEYVGFAKTILDRSNKGFQHMIKPPLVWGQRHS